MATTKKAPVKKAAAKKPALNKVVSKKLKSKKPATPLEKKLVFGCIAASVVAVIASLFIGVFFSPEKVAARKITYLAKDYYENYYYDKFVATIDKDFDKSFEKYKDSGFAPVYLRQLLLFDNERDAKYEKYFNIQNYSCNKNTTTVKFFPVEPYGKKDYKIEYTFSCNYE